MRLLLYASLRRTAGRRLMETLHSVVPGQVLNHFDSLPALTNHLRRPMGMEVLAILWPADADELAALIRLSHLLRNMRIILVLPDADPRTISDAHTLRPRFISFDDGDLADVAAVAAKILETRTAARCKPEDENRICRPALSRSAAL